MNPSKKIGIGFSLFTLASAVVYFTTSVIATEKANHAATNLKSEVGAITYAANAPQLSSIKVNAVTEVSLPIAESMNGKLAYDEDLTARVSSPVLGRVLSSHIEIGDSVSKNKPLAEIDSPDLANADADWTKAKTEEQRKRLAFERAKSLLEHDVIARKDFESAEAEYAQSQAEAKRSRLHMHNLNAIGNENGKFSLKAPIAGMIIDKQINPGMEVRPDAQIPLFVISDLNKLWVLIDVPERHIGDIKSGQKIGLELDAYPNQVFEAKVDRIGLALDPNTRRIQVRAVLFNKDKKLRPEMFAHVLFLSKGDKKAIKLPNTSLITEGLYSFVFVEKQVGEFKKQRVNIVKRGKEFSYVDSGLTSGQRVVTVGALLLNSEVATHAQ